MAAPNWVLTKSYIDKNWKLEDWNEKDWKLEGQFCIFAKKKEKKRERPIHEQKN